MLRALAIFTLVHLFLVSVSGQTTTETQTASKQVLRIGHTGDYAPFEYIDSSGVARGYLLDCYQFWSEKTGQPIEMVLLSWDECLLQLEDGRIDVITAMTPTEERRKKFLFGKPICKAESRVFTHTSLTPPTRALDLSGFAVGVVKGDRSARQLAAEVPSAVLRTESGYDVLAQKAAKGHLKILAGTSAVIHHMLTKEEVQGSFTTSAFTLNEDPMAATVKRDRPELIKILNAGFAQFSENDWEILARRWVPYSLKPGSGAFGVVMLWSAIAGGGLLIVIGGVLTWNWQLRRQLDTMLQRQADLSKSLSQAQRLDALGRMASGVAHDFNNVLQAILAHAEVLEDIVPEKGRGSTVAIANAAERASGLSRQLLTFARAEPLPVRRCDLNEIVEGTWQLLASTLGTGIERKMSLSQEPATVLADPDRLHSLLVNLAVNARDALEDHGTITIRTRIVTLNSIPLEAQEALGSNRGKVVQLSFSDNGPGIPKEIRDRIFDPFFTTKSPHRGTGLGLAAVYGTVKDSMGHIGIECGQGGGTTFHLYLPHADDPRNETASESEASLDTSGLTVLVVDDNPAIRETTTANLRMEGHRVLSAASGGEALHLLGVESNVDIAIIDRYMPGMDGLTLGRHLLNLHADLPLILATGNTNDLGNSHGFSAILPKPYRRDKLNKVIADVLAGS